MAKVNHKLEPNPSCIGLDMGSGMTKKLDIPEDIAQELFAVMETATKIKGENFANYAKFLMNLHGLLEIFGQNFEPSEQIRESPKRDTIIKQLEKMIANVCHTQSMMYAEALNLSSEDVNEAVQLARTVEGLVEEFRRRIPGSRE